MTTTREWLRFITAAAASIVKDLNIYGPIGPSWVDDDAIAASAFIAELAPVPASTKTPRVHVNSVGGDPFTPATIVGALRAQRVELGRTVEVHIEGLAVSAATVVTSAGNPIRISDAAVVMVHDPRAVAVGPAALMRRTADALDKVRDAIVSAYRWCSHLSEAALRKLMEDETVVASLEAELAELERAERVAEADRHAAVAASEADDWPRSRVAPSAYLHGRRG